MSVWLILVNCKACATGVIRIQKVKIRLRKNIILFPLFRNSFQHKLPTKSCRAVSQQQKATVEFIIVQSS